MRNPALKLITFVIIIVILLVSYFFQKDPSEEVKSWEFKGVIEKVVIDSPKTSPIIVVNGKKFDLIKIRMNSNVGFYKGDTIIKKKGEIVLKMIKPNSKDTIYCNKP